MTAFLSNVANDAAEHIDPTSADCGLSGAPRDLASESVRPLLYQRLCSRIASDLANLDDDVLRDIGLPRRDIRTYARIRAEARWPSRHSLPTVLASVPLAFWRALKRVNRRRATYSDFEMLNDNLLKDIGISRCQIPWVFMEAARRAGDPGSRIGRFRATCDMARVECMSNRASPPSRGFVVPGESVVESLGSPANDGPVRRAS